MNDSEIIDLYWQRSDRAIEETDRVYGPYCFRVANNVLGDRLDAEESVSDTWWAAWNAMPPTRPDSLRAFLAKLTRRIAISRLRRRSSRKRGGGETALALEELAECIPAPQNVERQLEQRELAAAVNQFLAALPERQRILFTARYFYVTPISDLARRLDMKPGAVKTQLFRLRKQLLSYLQEEHYVDEESAL